MPPRTAFARGRVASHLEGAGTATVQRALFADGGTQQAWPNVLTRVPVSIGTGRATDVVREGQTVSIIAVPLVFPAGTDIRAGDRVVIGTRTFQIIGPSGPVGTARETARVVQAEEVT